MVPSLWKVDSEVPTSQGSDLFSDIVEGVPARVGEQSEYSARAMSPTENDEPSKEFSK